MGSNQERGIVDKNGFQIKWADLIGPPECPMMKRWVFVTPLGSLRLHHFLRSDVDRHPHDHPWWFITLVLKGEYTDLAEIMRDGRHAVFMQDCLKRGSIRFRPALHRHWVHTDGCWTLIVTGRNRRSWGFWDRDVFRPVKQYFERYGYAPCE